MTAPTDIFETFNRKLKRRDQRRAAGQRYRDADPERSRAQWRKYKKKKVESAAGQERPTECEVCGRGGRICYDHCHKTGKFRGWLCVNCNLILGNVDDTPELLRRLAHYLEMNK